MDFNETRQNLITKISNIGSNTFDEVALEVFRFQVVFNPVYSKFVSLLGVEPSAINSIDQIPFLPISLFKNHQIKTGKWQEEAIFKSSGTTSQTTSQHFVRSLEWYNEISIKGFETQYSEKLENICILALLPSYLERSGSSLVHMAEQFIKKSNFSDSGFFLNDFEKLKNILKKCVDEKIPTLLLGVSFALIDFAEKYPIDLKHVIVMETGGMKGRRKEITRNELHEYLKNSFKTKSIHSEYGMTELLSQAYSKENGLFRSISTMKVLTREITDPLKIERIGRPGAINIIDLANIDSCSFIATDDLGKVYPDGSFEVLGRLDASDIRGCNLLVANN